MDVIYLDFDGVLHPAQGRRYRAAPAARHEFNGHVLFESCPVLEELLGPYPSLAIVLSTSWVQARGFRATKECLTPGLQARVIGATWDNRHLHVGDFAEASRYEQIRKDVEVRDSSRWLAIDDDNEGWADKDLDALALMPEALGLASSDAQALLRSRLAARFP